MKALNSTARRFGLTPAQIVAHMVTQGWDMDAVFSMDVLNQHCIFIRAARNARIAIKKVGA